MMAIRSLLKKARARLKEMLRPLLEDKEMRGDDFSHVRVTESGCLYIDEQSDAYKQIIARPRKHHSLHGVEPHLRQSAPRVDSLGRIILPLSIREKLGPGWAVECKELEAGEYTITVRRLDVVTFRAD
jgi:hypothetical protein